MFFGDNASDKKSAFGIASSPGTRPLVLARIVYRLPSSATPVRPRISARSVPRRARAAPRADGGAVTSMGELESAAGLLVLGHHKHWEVLAPVFARLHTIKASRASVANSCPAHVLSGDGWDYRKHTDEEWPAGIAAALLAAAWLASGGGVLFHVKHWMRMGADFPIIDIEVLVQSLVAPVVVTLGVGDVVSGSRADIAVTISPNRPPWSPHGTPKERSRTIVLITGI